MECRLKEFNITREEYDNMKKKSIPKRGKQRESFSDTTNLFNRAAFDEVGKLSKPENAKYSLTEAYTMGRLLFEDNCYICGQPLTNTGIQSDHIISAEHGGFGGPGNLLPTHTSCNDMKGNKLYEELECANTQTSRKLKAFQEMYEWTPLSKEVMNKIEEKNDELKELIKSVSTII